MNALSNLVRNVIVLMLALAGIAMAFVLMVSTAVALGVMYLVARVRGKPFAPAAFWKARRAGMQWQFARGATSGARAGAAPGSAARPARNDRNVIDVEVREVR